MPSVLIAQQAQAEPVQASSPLVAHPDVLIATLSIVAAIGLFIDKKLWPWFTERNKLRDEREDAARKNDLELRRIAQEQQFSMTHSLLETTIQQNKETLAALTKLADESRRLTTSLEESSRRTEAALHFLGNRVAALANKTSELMVMHQEFVSRTRQ